MNGKKANELIVKLKCSQFISNNMVLKIIQHCKDNLVWDYSSIELAQIAGLKGEAHLKFINSFSLNQEEITEKYITILDEEYPESLKEIYNPPAVLFFRGNIQLLKGKCISIVGSRRATYYGNKMVEKIVPNLVNHNIIMVSGMARGIDTQAHKITISNHGHTIGVIGPV